MSKVKDFLFAYLLRLPFFLLVFTVILIITRDYIVFYQLFAVFTILCALDMLPPHIRPFIVMIGFILSIVCMFVGHYATAAVLFIFSIYRPEQYEHVSSIIMVAVMFILTVIASVFIDPVIGNICVRNLVIATVIRILTRQIQSLDRFLSSYYCRGVSQKTAASVSRRSCILSITCLVGFIAIGFISQPVGEVIPVPDIIIERAESIYESVEIVFGVEEQEEIDVIEEEEELGGAVVPLLLHSGGEHRPGLIYLLVTAAAVAVIALFVFLYTKWCRYDTQFEDYEDIIEETAFTPEKPSKKSRKLLNFSINYTIRRLFRRKVKEYIVTKDLYTQKSDTPKQLAKTISEWEDIGTLENLYHKARYSNEIIKRSELNGL